jgi:uncharacterized membrane protein YuzA (DUF378 family)
MKASKWNTTDPPDAVWTRQVESALLSAGALSLGLLGFTSIDLIYAPFGPIMVFGQTIGMLTALAILFKLALPKLAPRPVPVRVRR